MNERGVLAIAFLPLILALVIMLIISGVLFLFFKNILAALVLGAIGSVLIYTNMYDLKKKDAKIITGLGIFFVLIGLMVGIVQPFSIVGGNIFSHEWSNNISASSSCMLGPGSLPSDCTVTRFGETVSQYRDQGTSGYDLRAYPTDLLEGLETNATSYTISWTGAVGGEGANETTSSTKIDFYSSSSDTSSFYGISGLSGVTAYWGNPAVYACQNNCPAPGSCNRCSYSSSTQTSVVLKKDGLYSSNGTRIAVLEKVVINGESKWFFGGKEVEHIYLVHEVYAASANRASYDVSSGNALASSVVSITPTYVNGGTGNDDNENGDVSSKPWDFNVWFQNIINNFTAFFAFR